MYTLTRFLPIVLFIAVLFGWRLHTIYTSPIDNADNVDLINECKYEDECLFAQAIKRKLIYPHGPILNVVTLDAIDLKTNNAKILKRLYYSEPGKLIRREIKSWNDSRQVVAIRYKITTNPLHRSLSSIYLQTYELQSSDDDIRPGRFLIPTDTHVPESFGYVHNKSLNSGFSEWESAHIGDNPVLFRYSFKLLAPTRFNIQFIGHFQNGNIKIGAINRIINHDDIEIACDPNRLKQNNLVCNKNFSTAGSIEIPLEATSYPTNVVLQWVAKSVANTQKQVDGLRIKTNLSDQYIWRRIKPRQRQHISRYQFTTTGPDFLPLLNLDGSANICSEKLGLVPVLGVDRSFSYSLNGLIANSRLPNDNTQIELSIDALLQKHAHEVLTEALTRKKDNDNTDTKKPWFQKLQTTLKPEDDPNRRAALLVLDADSGAILATAGWPNLPPLKSLSPWDLKSFHKVYEKHGHVSPLEVQAWQILNRDNTPGSIFKPLVAIAAAKSLNTKNDFLREYLTGIRADQWNQKMAAWDIKEGRLPPGYIGRPRITDGQYKPVPRKKSIANYKRQALSRQFQNGQISLKEGLQKSSNLWFIKLAMIMDRMNAWKFDQKQKLWRRSHANDTIKQKKQIVDDALLETPIFLRNTMLQMGFGKSLNLFNWHKQKEISWPADDYVKRTLSAQPSIANLLNYKLLFNDRIEWPLAQTAIGQAGVQVTPLHIAIIIASIANNRYVRPNLIRHINKVKLNDSPFEPMQVDPEILQLIHAGMKAVPEAGTAAGAFARSKHTDTNIVYGKTGTAEIKLVKKNQIIYQTKTVWFVGWRDPKPEMEQTRPEPRKLAFACMVTHADGTGGGTCAPIIAEFFNRINEPTKDKFADCQPNG